MNDSQKFQTLFGGIFFGVGVILLFAGIIVIALGGGIGGIIPLGMSLIFGGIGAGFLIHSYRTSIRMKKILKAGTRYIGKIHSYIENKSVVVNGDYLLNTKVHYFDNNGIEREAVINTMFIKGSSDFPIGATIDIVEYKGKYSWVPGSVRYEIIPREAELMDNKPIDPTMVNMIAIICPGCGVSFSTAQGYVARCPYCGGAINT